MKSAATTHRLQYISEAFADRAYQKNGQLVPRNMAGAVLLDGATCAAQAESIAKRRQVTTLSGELINCAAETITLHSDTMDAVKIALEIKRHLIAAGLEIGAKDAVFP